MYWHISKSKSKLNTYFRTFVFFLYVRYYMSGLSSPSHCVAMATKHFSTTVAWFYFSGLIMTKYQNDSCILDVLPSMVNKGLRWVWYIFHMKNKIGLSLSEVHIADCNSKSSGKQKLVTLRPLKFLWDNILWINYDGFVVWW